LVPHFLIRIYMKTLAFSFILFSMQFAFAQVSLSTSPRNLSFNQVVGQTKTKSSSVFINNFSEGSVTLSVRHNCSQDYRVSTTCYGAFWNNGVCNVRVAFAPKNQGNSSCFVRIWGVPSGYADVRVTGKAHMQPATSDSENF
jgi:hypothetical protein